MTFVFQCDDDGAGFLEGLNQRESEVSLRTIMINLINW